MNPLHAHLRAETAAAHQRTDTALSHFDLSDPAGYTGFLLTHARIVPAIEQAIAPSALYPQASERAALLAGDLADLGTAMPATIACAPVTEEAARWGMLYVLEGSRLGGDMLSRTLPEGFPRRYLGHVHGQGGWRAFLAALAAAGEEGGEPWRDEATAAANRLFALFLDSAQPVATDKAAS